MKATAKSGSMPDAHPAMIEIVPVGATVSTLQLRSRRSGRIRSPFGARAQLYAAAYGFSIQGDVGYDVLIQLVPFHFLADFHASVQLKRGSRNLFKVSVAGALEGPRPLRVSGKASFEIFWCDFSVRFDKTLVGGEKPPPSPT